MKVNAPLPLSNTVTRSLSSLLSVANMRYTLATHSLALFLPAIHMHQKTLFICVSNLFVHHIPLNLSVFRLFASRNSFSQIKFMCLPTSITILFVFLLWRCAVVCSHHSTYLIVPLSLFIFNDSYTQIYNKHSDWIVLILVISVSESVKVNINNLLSAHKYTRTHTQQDVYRTLYFMKNYDTHWICCSTVNTHQWPNAMKFVKLIVDIYLYATC